MVRGLNVSAVAQSLPPWIKRAMNRTRAGQRLLSWGRKRANYRKLPKYKSALKRYKKLPSALRNKIRKY